MPVVTTLFEFFLLLYSGNSVANRFRTVQSRCFAHSQIGVTSPFETVRKVHSVSDRNAVPTVRNAGPHASLSDCVYASPAYWCMMLYVLLCYAVVCLCVCAVVMCVLCFSVVILVIFLASDTEKSRFMRLF